MTWAEIRLSNAVLTRFADAGAWADTDVIASIVLDLLDQAPQHIKGKPEAARPTDGVADNQPFSRPTMQIDSQSCRTPHDERDILREVCRTFDAQIVAPDLIDLDFRHCFLTLSVEYVINVSCAIIIVGWDVVRFVGIFVGIYEVLEKSAQADGGASGARGDAELSPPSRSARLKNF